MRYGTGSYLKTSNSHSEKTKQVAPAPISVAEKSTDKDAQITSKLAAFYALDAWEEAWENQDTKAYLLSYSKNFTPNRSLSQKDWKEKRSKSNARITYTSTLHARQA